MSHLFETEVSKYECCSQECVDNESARARLSEPNNYKELSLGLPPHQKYILDVNFMNMVDVTTAMWPVNFYNFMI